MKETWRHTKVSEAWDRLERADCSETADANLVAFQSRYTTIGHDGISYVSYPDGTTEKIANRPRRSLAGGGQSSRSVNHPMSPPEPLSRR